VFSCSTQGSSLVMGFQPRPRHKSRRAKAPKHVIPSGVLIISRSRARFEFKGPAMPLHLRQVANVKCVASIGVMLGGMVALYNQRIPYTSYAEAAECQMELFGASLEVYELDTGRFPRTSEGMGALIVRPVGCRNWHGPYLDDRLPLDPWQVPYEYQSDGFVLQIRSSGSDRVLGSKTTSASPSESRRYGDFERASR